MAAPTASAAPGTSAAAVAPSERISSIASASTRPNPSSSAIVTGKNVTSTTIRTLGSSPNPNQMTNSGAMATIGMVWLVTSSGSTARRTGAQRSRAIGRHDREDHRQRAADERLDQGRDEVGDGRLAEVPQRAEHPRSAPAG